VHRHGADLVENIGILSMARPAGENGYMRRQKVAEPAQFVV
jgi:hypothetical protein